MRPVLLIEDDNVDARVVKRAFTEMSLAPPLIHVTNGEEALAYLQDESAQPPYLVLLDLDIPGMSGLDLLKTIRAEEALSRIPVVIVTTSDRPLDKDMSLRLGAVDYIHKSPDYRDVLEAIKKLVGYWSLSGCP